MKKKILITGANGFIGQSLIHSLDKSYFDIYALGSKNTIYSDTQAVKEYLSIDISKPFYINMTFDVIIHLAALNQTNINSNFSYDKFQTVNVNGTQNVLNSCSFNKFIFFSTANIYEKKGKKIDESSPIKPGSFYEQTKYEAELICQKYIDNKKLVILRPVNITGIRQANKAIIPHFFTKAVKNENIEIFVPKNRRVQLLSIEDVNRAVAAIIADEHINGIFNLSGKDSLEVEAIAERIISICNSSSQILCTNNNLESFSEVSSDKARQELNWSSIYSIETIINDFASSFLQKR